MTAPPSNHPESDALWQPEPLAVPSPHYNYTFADNYREDEYKFACGMEEQRDQAVAAYETIKSQMHKYEEILITLLGELDDKADGAPDSSDVAQFANRLSGIYNGLMLGEVQTLKMKHHELTLERDSLKEQLQIDQWIKGQWKCPTCNFILSKNVLSMRDGNVYANAEPFNELCPNDGTAMRSLTYKESYHDICKCCEQQVERAVKAETELAEAQQWIDSEPDWKDKYTANMILVCKERDEAVIRADKNDGLWQNAEHEVASLKSENQSLIAQMVVVVVALKRVGLCDCREIPHNSSCKFAIAQSAIASTSLAAKDMLERVERMEKVFVQIKQYALDHNDEMIPDWIDQATTK